MYYKSIYYALLMVIFGVLGYIFLESGFNTKTKVKVEYEDKSDVIYKVNYLEEDYISTGDRYVSSMVDDIDISYNYENIISEYIAGYYRYSVDASLITYLESSKDSLWKRDYKLVNEKTVLLDAGKINNININDKFVIDFDRYREEVYSFMKQYDMEVSGYLNIKINILEALNFESLNNQYEDTKVINVNIPLTQDTFKINVDNINSINNCYELVTDGAMNIIFLIIGAFCGSVSLALLILVLRQFKIINDMENEYNKQLDKILSKYDEQIVKIKRFYVSKKYNMIYVDSFKELMDVANNENKMISFKETKRDSESVFVVISENDAWIYRLLANKEK